jgi:hypothetical protein
VDAGKILAVKVGTSIQPACLPCQPACLVCACCEHSYFAKVDIFVNYYALSNLLFLDIYAYSPLGMFMFCIFCLG